MGPPSMNGGRRSTSGNVTRLRSRSFNGAAVDERRKEAPGAEELPENVTASMGPPSMNGGRLGARVLAPLGMPASMGPPSMNGGRRFRL